MKREIINNINQAFLQLEFSIKLLTYIELGKVDKEDFDTHVILPGRVVNLSFFHNSFNTYDDIEKGAHNNYNITLGFTSIVLEDAFQSIGSVSNPSDHTPNGTLRTLIYMIRCAYAHNMMHPTWEVREKYRFSLTINLLHETLELDLSKKDGQPFDMADIGDLDNYLEIKDKVCLIISEAQ